VFKQQLNLSMSPLLYAFLIDKVFFIFYSLCSILFIHLYIVGLQCDTKLHQAELLKFIFLDEMIKIAGYAHICECYTFGFIYETLSVYNF